jgi:hypothetical protein
MHAKQNVQFTLDKGNQAGSGADMTVIGNVANGLTQPQWAIVKRRASHAHPIRASGTGDLWLAVGTDSGFEGQSEFYFTSMAVTLAPLP